MIGRLFEELKFSVNTSLKQLLGGKGGRKRIEPKSKTDEIEGAPFVCSPAKLGLIPPSAEKFFKVSNSLNPLIPFLNFTGHFRWGLHGGRGLDFYLRAGFWNTRSFKKKKGVNIGPLFDLGAGGSWLGPNGGIFILWGAREHKYLSIGAYPL